MSWAKAIQRAREDPRLAIEVGMALARGQYYRLLFRLRGQRVVIGSGFQVTGKLDIRGPGTVIFGNAASVDTITVVAPSNVARVTYRASRSVNTSTCPPNARSKASR